MFQMSQAVAKSLDNFFSQPKIFEMEHLHKWWWWKFEGSSCQEISAETSHQHRSVSVDVEYLNSLFFFFFRVLFRPATFGHVVHLNTCLITTSFSSSTSIREFYGPKRRHTIPSLALICGFVRKHFRIFLPFSYSLTLFRSKKKTTKTTNNNALAACENFPQTQNRHPNQEATCAFIDKAKGTWLKNILLPVFIQQEPTASIKEREWNTIHAG